MSGELKSDAVEPTGDAPFEDRFLLFSLDEARYALAVSGISGLAPSGPLRPVPRAPAAVLGLTEWRGNVLTVIDLSRLLGVKSWCGHDCLVRLAPPWHRTALRIPATVRLAPQELTSRAAPHDHRVLIDGEMVRLLDVSALVRRVEAETKDRG